MARIISAVFPLAEGTITRNVTQGAVILGVRLDGPQGRIFALAPNPAAPTEVRKFHLVLGGSDLVGTPTDFDFIGIITTAAGVDWFVWERTVG